MIEEKMRAAKFTGDCKITVEKKPVPMPAEGQLLIRVTGNALCGSERGQFLRGAPVTPGHEAAGVVVAAGTKTKTPVGTNGAVFLMDFCGECRNCTQGATNQCLHKRGDMGFNRDGGYAEYELVNENIFFPSGVIAGADATLLLDIMGTGGHAISRGLLAHRDVQSVLVSGAGPIGLGVLAMAKLLLGDLPVAITDVVSYRLALAEQMGGLPINLKQTTVDAGLKQHGLEHVDFAIDTSGKEMARQASLDALDKRGVLVLVGHGEGIRMDVSSQMIAPERAVLGSEYFRFDELPANLELLRRHRDYLSQIITHRFPLADIQHAFELFFKGDTGKVIIEP
jgi:threonine dehydrogenase-like Zn-dependent dehydrogenase